MRVQGNGKPEGAGKGRGRGGLDPLATDIEAALRRTPAEVPGKAARTRASAVQLLELEPITETIIHIGIRAAQDSTLITHRFPHGVNLEMMLGKDENVRKKRVLPPRDPDTEYRLACYILDRKTCRLVTHGLGAEIKADVMRRAQSNDPKMIQQARRDVDALIQREVDIVRAVNLHDTKRYAFVVPARQIKDAMRSAVRFLKGEEHEDGSVSITDSYVRQTLHVFGDYGDYCEILSEPRVPQMREDIVNIGKFPNVVPQLRFRPEFENWSMKLKIRFLTQYMTEELVGRLLQRGGLVCGIAENRPEKSGASNGMFTVTA